MDRDHHHPASVGMTSRPSLWPLSQDHQSTTDLICRGLMRIGTLGARRNSKTNVTLQLSGRSRSADRSARTVIDIAKFACRRPRMIKLSSNFFISETGGKKNHASLAMPPSLIPNASDWSRLQVLLCSLSR